jgi:hypothetical protein
MIPISVCAGGENRLRKRRRGREIERKRKVVSPGIELGVLYVQEGRIG